MSAIDCFTPGFYAVESTISKAAQGMSVVTHAQNTVNQDRMRKQFAASLFFSITVAIRIPKVLNFAEEKEYIWSKKWSAGKVMYLITRYSGAAFLILVILDVFELAWYDLSVFGAPSAYDSWLFTWSDNLYVASGPPIILLAEIILQIRVYAMYGRKKRVLTLLIFLSIFSSGIAIIQPLGLAYGATLPLSVGKISGAFEGYSCIASTIPMSGTGWLTASTVEFILFVMVFMKYRQTKSDRIILSLTAGSVAESRMHDITTIMAKDSTTYFAIIFTICFIGTCVSFVTQGKNMANNPIAVTMGTQLNAYETLTVVIMTLLAPNLLLKLRVEYYGPTEEISLATWNAAEPELDGTYGEAQRDLATGALSDV
ncbi:hypothetical protein M0805_006215 [Coniferiporia weirii]|nr:hypothetical protein M0805_006215 [Coniferiporia weirii]